MRKNLIRLSIILSLLLHGVLFGILRLSPSRDLFKPKDELTEIDVELLDPKKLLKQPNELPKGQIVEQDKSINKEKPEDAKFLSREDQKITQETQAQQGDRFNNSIGATGPQSPQRKSGQTEEREEEDLSKSKQDKLRKLATRPDGLKGLPDLKSLKPKLDLGPKEPASGGGTGPAMTDDHLQNVETGLQTLLNTREFVYYSYYNRIKDKLRQYWEPKIKEKMTRILQQGRKIASSDDRITKIVIHLDASGKLIRVQVVGASGLQDLDEAAIEAFKAAAPFPNPPKGIVDEDGTIKIRWDFILEASRIGVPEATNVALSGE